MPQPAYSLSSYHLPTPAPPPPGAAAGRASGRCAGQGLAAGGRCGAALRGLLGAHPAVPGAAGGGPGGRLAPAQLRGLRAQDLGTLHVLQQLRAESAALRIPGFPLPSGLPRRLPLRSPAAPAAPGVWSLLPHRPPHGVAPPGRPPGHRQDPNVRQRCVCPEGARRLCVLREYAAPLWAGSGRIELGPSGTGA